MKTILVAVAIFFGVSALGSEDSIHLKDAPGRDKVLVSCVMCHSLDYIPMNGFLDRAGWEKEVNKMINVMGAPVKKEDVPQILDYLVKNYGAQP